ncbi:MAG: ABC transporter substrate-binding protein [Gammaproteobacteria bacterium]|jgi:ABC-type nitrate/sulfonate/bicarbonate transport system substrate-binding protein|nr:ABC transporter substrate-binding protein [Gammaproteobacteria bacterium]
MQAPIQTPLRLAGVEYLGDLPTLIAAEQRLFERHGIAVEVAFTGSGRDNLAKLRAGETDFALMALTPLVLDLLNDPNPGATDDPVILASMLHSTSLNQVAFRTDQGIETPADLRGRRLALPQGTNAEFLWWVFRTMHGLEPGDLAVRHDPIDAIPALLRAGHIDAAVIWEPDIARLRGQLGPRLGQFSISRFYTARWVLVTRRETAEARAEVCSALLRAYRDAIDRIERQGRASLARFAERFDAPLDELSRDWNALDYDLSLDWSLIAALQEQLHWAERSIQQQDRQQGQEQDRQQSHQPAAQQTGPPAGWRLGQGDPPRPRQLSVLALIAAGPLRQQFPSAVGIPSQRPIPPRRAPER